MSDIGVNDQVSVRMTAGWWLQLVGWIQAKRPEGDWDPNFLTGVLAAIQGSIETASEQEARNV